MQHSTNFATIYYEIKHEIEMLILRLIANDWEITYTGHDK